MRKFAFILLLFTFYVSPLAFHVLAQLPTQEWVARWPGGSLNGSSEGRSVKIDSQGFIYILADSGSRGFGFLKYSPNGTFLLRGHHWPGGTYTSGGGTCFDVTPLGDVYISGGLNINLDHWIYIVKFNSSGILQWEKLYNRDNEDTPEDLKIDNQNNIVVVGSAVIGSTGYGLAIKYNSSGDTLWTRNFNNSSFRNSLLDNFNNLYITGHLDYNFLALKYSSTGNLTWFTTFTFDSSNTTIGHNIAFDIFGNVYVIGGIAVITRIHSFLSKLSNTGTVLWSRVSTLRNNGGYGISGPVVSSDGNSIYYTSMASNGTGGGGYSFATHKYNSVGDSQWVKTYFGGVNATGNFPSNIKLDRYDNIYVCGSAYYAATGSDFTTIKYTSTGIQQWVTNYTGIITNGGDGANDLYIDTNLNIYVTGLSKKMNNFNYDAVTIKYNQPIGIISNNNELPKNYKLYQNYPNPFNPNSKIKYQIAKSNQSVKILLFDIMGREIAQLVNQKQNAGTYEVDFDGSNYASGIYFYTIEARLAGSSTVDYKASRKMVLVK